MKKVLALTGLLVFAFCMITVDVTIADDKARGRFLVLWEMDQSRIPPDPKVRGAAWTPLIAMVKGDIQSGLTIGWGGFVGTTKGYTIMEGTVQEVHNALHRYVPFGVFEVYPVATLDQVAAMIKGLTME